MSRPLEFAALDDDRTIAVEWSWQGDDDTPARYIAQLADSLWRHQNAENFATLGALVVACQAVAGDDDARSNLDTNQAWRVGASNRQDGG